MSVTEGQYDTLVGVFDRKGITGSIQNATLNYTKDELRKYLGQGWTAGEVENVSKAFRKCATLLPSGGLSRTKLDELWQTAAKPKPKPKPAPSSSSSSRATTTVTQKEYQRIATKAAKAMEDLREATSRIKIRA